MLLKRHLDLYTIADPFALKTRFWSWYQRALRGTDRVVDVLSRPYYTKPLSYKEVDPYFLDPYYLDGKYKVSSLPTTTRSGQLRTPPLGFYNQDVSPYRTGAGVTRDPWWWSYPHLRPYQASSYPYRSFIPSYSYLSPVKRSYVWNTRPHRPISLNKFVIEMADETPANVEEGTADNNKSAAGSKRASDVGKESIHSIARQSWGSDYEYLLSSIGYGVGFGNVWRFPYLTYRYGGGAFLIPFIFFMFSVALPLMLLESSASQYAGMGPLHLYGSICPAFKGLGMTTLYISLANSVQYIIILAYVVRYTATSFTRKLPWEECSPLLSYDGCYGRCRGQPKDKKYVVFGKACHPAEEFCTTDPATKLVQCKTNNGTELNTQDAAFSFFYDQVLDMRLKDGSVSLFETSYGHLVPKLFLSVFASYLITGLVLQHGVATSGKVVYFTATFPYLVLAIMLIRAATLNGFLTGIKYYLKPDLSKLWTFEIWYQALSQTFFSLGVGFGGLMTLSSYNRFNAPMLKLCFTAVIVNVCTSLFAGFVIFGSLGYIADETGQSIDSVAGSGMSLTFVTIPTTLSMLPAAPFWAVLFFFMLITVGIDTQMADMETQITSVLDHFTWMRAYKSFVTLGVCCVGMAVATSMTFQSGLWVNALLNDYAATAPVLLLAMCNVLVMAYIYGYKNMLINLEDMVGPLRKPVRWYLMSTWLVIAPLFTIALLIYFFLDFTGSVYDKPGPDGLYPSWVQKIGVFLGAIPLIFIPIGMSHQLWVSKRSNPTKSMREVFFNMFVPDKDFKPRTEKEDAGRISFLEFLQPSHPTDYVPPKGMATDDSSYNGPNDGEDGRN
ncbi:unnamed protein product [Notodromas monacha]|uniref:Transporter n=1 Tax=Notodromas monacha TaxID=399045 RepID=A0A7R9BEL4_9CRUS|nr:unnamed protein product [Notodromas monacha]CAG0913068.1 unnamed protein product [Notodromas monacha]